eukprot:TRINITY_DN329_c0_g1_i1.p1 TRINITY_DN329_c0_g1~~TRINITY_DN329_c0_g1_i1.p1  ORF type:complete len:563 (+),score=64.98 TRINITY_DN329_c0_g1_i1:217-1689(+)
MRVIIYDDHYNELQQDTRLEDIPARVRAKLVPEIFVPEMKSPHNSSTPEELRDSAPKQPEAMTKISGEGTEGGTELDQFAIAPARLKWAQTVYRYTVGPNDQAGYLLCPPLQVDCAVDAFARCARYTAVNGNHLGKLNLSKTGHLMLQDKFAPGEVVSLKVCASAANAFAFTTVTVMGVRIESENGINWSHSNTTQQTDDSTTHCDTQQSTPTSALAYPAAFALVVEENTERREIEQQETQEAPSLGTEMTKLWTQASNQVTQLQDMICSLQKIQTQNEEELQTLKLELGYMRDQDIASTTEIALLTSELEHWEQQNAALSEKLKQAAQQQAQEEECNAWRRGYTRHLEEEVKKLQLQQLQQQREITALRTQLENVTEHASQWQQHQNELKSQVQVKELQLQQLLQNVQTPLETTINRLMDICMKTSQSNKERCSQFVSICTQCSLPDELQALFSQHKWRDDHFYSAPDWEQLWLALGRYLGPHRYQHPR